MDSTTTQINYATLTNGELAKVAKDTWNRGDFGREEKQVLGPVFHELVGRIEQAPDNPDTS